MSDVEAENSDKTQEQMSPPYLPPADQSDDNVGIAVPKLPPMITAEGPALSEFAAAASMQLERFPSMPVASPMNFLPIMSVVITNTEKNEANYMTDVSHSDNPTAADSRNTIESEAAVLASATAVIQGRKRPAETRHGLCHIGKNYR
eukprot:13109205-Ditylum_brightwellii.AAC.1